MKTVRVKIAIAMDAQGHYTASGWRDSAGDAAKKDLDANARDMFGMTFDADPAVIHYVEADLPVPEGVTVEGEVTT